MLKLKGFNQVNERKISTYLMKRILLDVDKYLKVQSEAYSIQKLLVLLTNFN